MKLNRKKRKIIWSHKNNLRKNLTVKKPFKPLTTTLRSRVGKNHTGSITVRHKERGAKKTYRIIAFKREIKDVIGTIQTIEYCPNRTAFISLVKYQLPETKTTASKALYEYILTPQDVKVGDQIIFSDKEIELTPGSCTMLCNIPQGEIVHNVALKPNNRGQIGRSAGCFITIIDHVEEYTLLKLPSGFMIKVKKTCYACIGKLSNATHNKYRLYKAGQSRNKGRRPRVRGVAMNSNAHPHGGGEGRTGTKRHPVSYTSKLTKGKKTISRRAKLNKNILKRKKKH